MQQYSNSFYHPYPISSFIHQSQYVTQQRQTTFQIPPQFSHQSQGMGPFSQPQYLHQPTNYNQSQVIPQPIQQQSYPINQQNYPPQVQQQSIIQQSTIQQQQIPQTRTSLQNDQKQQKQQPQYENQNKVIQPHAKQSQQKLIPNQAIPQSPPSQPQSKVQQQHHQQVQQQQQINKPLQKILQPYQSKKDDELEKQFQITNDRPKDLIQKHQNPEVKQPQQTQQQSKPQQQQQQQPQPKQEQQTNKQQVKDNQLQQLALQYEDGFIYKGQGYEPATREGQGILTDQNDNIVYNGQWKDNQYHGQGKLINIQAEEIEGPFDYQDLSVIENGWLGYEGNFSQGRMNGFGKLQLTNGEVFEGQFQDGIIDGQGIFSTVNGQTLKGLWRVGVLDKVFA